MTPVKGSFRPKGGFNHILALKIPDLVGLCCLGGWYLPHEFLVLQEDREHGNLVVYPMNTGAKQWVCGVNEVWTSS